MIRTLIAAAALSLALVPAPAVAQASFQNMAPELRFLAVATFVEEYCPGMSADLLATKVAIEAVGGDIDRLQKQPAKLRQVQLLVNYLAGDVKQSCRMMWGFFGDEGTTLPGIITKD